MYAARHNSLELGMRDVGVSESLLPDLLDDNVRVSNHMINHFTHKGVLRLS